MRRSRVRLRSRFGVGLAALALVGLLVFSLSLGGARSASAVVGDCTPGSNWGILGTSFADQVLTLVNQHRTALGLSPLVTSPTLTASAQWKSLHMAEYQYMEHDDPAPPLARAWSDRLIACGYPQNSWMGENIAYGYSTPDAVMTGWLNSPGHRANIESTNYDAIGIAAARGANGYWYWTQDFGSVVDGGGGSSGGGAGGGGGITVPAPTVSLTSTPPASTTATSASFTWSTTGSPTSTTCSLDGAAATSCSSGVAFSGLAAGQHTFQVNVSGSSGSNSASFAWTVSPTASKPTVTLTSTPASSTTSTGATFVWTSTSSPTATTCSLDGAPATACASPTSYSGLGVGGHAFTVTVANSAGTGSASYDWTVSAAVVTPTVTLTRTPPATTLFSGATFAWAATGSPTSTMCSVDGEVPAVCTSPTSIGGLAPGQHTFVVTVSSDTGSSSASYSWLQSPKAPRISFTRTPADGTTHAKFAWSGTRYATATCSVDGGAATPCTSPTWVTVRAGGTHTFTVAASNVTGSDSATFTWTT